jgi:hypothetical protein
MFTDKQHEVIQSLRYRYYMHISDGWRCDFCEPGCDCDEIYLERLVNDYVNEFLTTENLHVVKDMIMEC